METVSYQETAWTCLNVSLQRLESSDGLTWFSPDKTHADACISGMWMFPMYSPSWGCPWLRSSWPGTTRQAAAGPASSSPSGFQIISLTKPTRPTEALEARHDQRYLTPQNRSFKEDTDWRSEKWKERKLLQPVTSYIAALSPWQVEIYWNLIGS